jgi:hypothetical protein
MSDDTQRWINHERTEHTVEPYSVYRSTLRYMPSEPCTNLSAIVPRRPIFDVGVGGDRAEALVSATGSGNGADAWS